MKSHHKYSKTSHQRLTLYIIVIWIIFGIFLLFQYRKGSFDAKLKTISENNEQKNSELLLQLEQQLEKQQILMDKLNHAQKKISQMYKNSEVYRDVDDDEPLQNLQSSNHIPILIFTYQRANYLHRCLEVLFK